MTRVTKILEATLIAGAATVTFTDSDIPNSLIRVYSTNSNIYPQNISLSGNVLTVTYEIQTSNLGVALELVKQELDIVNDVVSTDTDKALSANQGKLLKDDIDDLSEVVSNLDIPDNITDLDDVDINNIQNGQVIAWDDLTEKFTNVSQGGSSVIYDTTETVIGTYNGKPLYRNVITGLSASATWQGTYFPNAAITAPISNVKEIISSRAIMNYSEGISRNSICSVVLNNNNNVWSLIVCDDITINTLILEYTKTTD